MVRNRAKLCEACHDDSDTQGITMVNQSAKAFLVQASGLEAFRTKDDKELNDADINRVFQRAWRKEIEPALRVAKVCGYDWARTVVKGDGKKYVRRQDTQFYFTLEDAVFIAQLTCPHVCTDLWLITPPKDTPRSLKIQFRNSSIKNEFRELAKRMKWQPTKLAEKLIVDFMETVVRKQLPRSTTPPPSQVESE